MEKPSPTLNQTDLRVANHRRQNFIVTNASFIQNSNQMASRLTAATSLAKVFFSTPAIFKATSKLFSSQGRLDFRRSLVSGLPSSRREFGVGEARAPFPEERLIIEPTHRAALTREIDLILPALSRPRFVDFAVHFCFRCKFSFHE